MPPPGARRSAVRAVSAPEGISIRPSVTGSFISPAGISPVGMSLGDALPTTMRADLALPLLGERRPFRDCFLATMCHLHRMIVVVAASPRIASGGSASGTGARQAPRSLRPIETAFFVANYRLLNRLSELITMR
jgi:hypothetical protein